MCRMVAIKAKKDVETKIYFEFLKSMAVGGIKNPHGDGFGVFYVSQDRAGILRDTASIWSTEYHPPKAWLSLFHARKASPGYKVNLNHVHPFIASIEEKTYVFAHNGTIHGISSENGQIDSQYYFSKILEKLQKMSPKEALLESAKEIEKERKFTSLTCFLSDFENIWAMKYCSDPEDSYHNLYYTEHNGVKILSSEPIQKYIDIDIKNFRELGNREVIVI
ncbi:MAG: hypothetical protein PWQ27_638 [Kosmotoga sp.]|nr:hypothetical protein [Kosmotoga sp.]